LTRLLTQRPQCQDAVARSHDGPRLKWLGLLALAGAGRPHAVVTSCAGATVVLPTCARRWLRCDTVGGMSTMEGRRTHQAIGGWRGSPTGSIDCEAEGYSGVAECDRW
jgi:hypothetical protein